MFAKPNENKQLLRGKFRNTPKFLGGPCLVSYQILVPQPGIEPEPSVAEGQSLNDWTTREVLKHSFLKFMNVCKILANDFYDSTRTTFFNLLMW